MEKEPQPESMATVTIKPDYPPSEYSTEPPPAYHKPKSTAVKITKIVAVTIVLTSVILGSFLLATAYVSANANWRQLEQELELLSETSDHLHGPLQPEALIQENPNAQQLQSAESPAVDSQKKDDTKEIETNSIDNDSDNSDSSESSNSSSESVEDERSQVPIHFPMDLGELAGALLEKNQKTKMNCIVEKKKAEEIVDHQPKLIRLPFGVNITTDPKYEKLSGERMVIVCESGTFQRNEPPQTPSPPKEEEDQDDDTILIQHVMIPIPETKFQTHMPQQMPPMMQNALPMRLPIRFPMRPVMNSMETMRPPVPPMMQIQIQAQQDTPQQPQQQSHEFPPNSVLQHIVQQIIAQKIMNAQKAREEARQRELQQQEQPQPLAQMQEIEENRIPHRFQIPPQFMGQRIPIPEEILTQLNRLPNRDVIVAVSESDSNFEDNSPEDSSEMRSPQEIRPMQRPIPLQIRPIPQEMRIMRPIVQEMRQMPQEIRQLPQELRQVPQELRQVPQELRQVPQEMRPIPQIQLVPQEIHIVPQPERMVPPQKMEEDKDRQHEVQVAQMRMIPQEPQSRQEPELRFIQEQRQSAVEMNGRQSYEQAVPVPIPVAIMQQQNEQESQESQAGNEESRPHFVQPRSIQPVDTLDS